MKEILKSNRKMVKITVSNPEKNKCPIYKNNRDPVYDSNHRNITEERIDLDWVWKREYEQNIKGNWKWQRMEG